jgi:hypothetical protein
MRKFVTSALFLTLLFLTQASSVQAQEDGPGGILDWIHKLSGPSMIGPAGSWHYTFESGTRIRGGAAYRFPLASGETMTEGYSLHQFSLQPEIEIPLSGPLGISAGLGLHWFFGDPEETVFNWSIPVLAQVRFPIDEEDLWFFRFGMGPMYFGSFDPEDFGDDVMVDLDGGELTFGVIIGVDYVRR